MERNESISTEQSSIVEQLRGEATSAFHSLKSIFEARMAIAEADNAVNLPEYQTISNQWSTLTQQYNDAVTRNSGSNGAIGEK